MSLSESPIPQPQQLPGSPKNSTQWHAVITDLIQHASTTTDRIAVMEQCKKALQDEAGDASLWRLYGDWVWLLYKVTHNVNGVYPNCTLDDDLTQQPWSQEDAVIGQVVFQWAGMMDVWQQGVKATQWHINDGNLVWDPYMELLLYDLTLSSPQDKVEAVRVIFLERLRQPHATWNDTFSTFSQFTSTYYEDSYERMMSDTNAKGQKAKQEYELRREYEEILTRLQRSGDEEGEAHAISEYLEWEDDQQRRKKGAPTFARDLYLALCERATLRFPTIPDFWLDRIVALMQRADDSESLLLVAERATMHCRGSGELWQKRLYAMEACDKDFHEIAVVKHTATSSGLLEDVGNMQELILVEFAWCSYLRRRAFAPTATEEDHDVAEVALRSAIENVWTVGHKKYGKAFKGDPEFRMERIYLKFLSQAGRIEEARKEFRKLESTHGDSHYFWERWYIFEMMVYDSRFDQTSRASTDGLPPPKAATDALARGIKRPNLDYPEKVIDMYLHHCAQHETARKLLAAQVETRRLLKSVAKMREKQYAEAAAAQQLTLLSQTPGPEYPTPDQSETSVKRKRDGEVDGDSGSKKARRESDAADVPMVDGNESAAAPKKRDRENTTVVVKHLPSSVTEAGIKRFFRDCGEILSTTIVQTPKKADDATATIEFASKEDVLSAQTKDMKTFEGQAIKISIGVGTTIYVTNYPAFADEKYIRGIFHRFGEITQVRFPSLKFNSHRRFCYVQFVTSDQAQAATQMDGKAEKGGMILTAKISDPDAKKTRDSAMEEGRELFVGNLHRLARDVEVEELFAAHGSVDSVRIPTNLKGQSKGSAFVRFHTKEDALKALDAVNNTDFKDRILKVELSKPKAQTSSTVLVDNQRVSASPAPSSAAGTEVTTGAADDDASMPDASSPPPTTAAQRSHHKQRTLALLNLPDTLNSARIRALCEPHGSLVKIILRPDHGGALVEFEDEAGMGRASMALDGLDLEAGVKIKIGGADELFRGRAFEKDSGGGGAAKAANGDRGGKPAKGGSKGAEKPFLAPPKPVARPVQHGSVGVGGRKRGGLGYRAAPTNSTSGDSNGAAKGKSQDDFRALIAAGSAAGSAPEAGDGAEAEAGANGTSENSKPVAASAEAAEANGA